MSKITLHFDMELSELVPFLAYMEVILSQHDSNQRRVIKIKKVVVES